MSDGAFDGCLERGGRESESVMEVASHCAVLADLGDAKGTFPLVCELEGVGSSGDGVGEEGGPAVVVEVWARAIGAGSLQDDL